MANKAECPRCDGMGDHGLDEAGCRYACYFCGMSGFVDAAVRADFLRAEAWGRFVEAEKALLERLRLGVPHGCGYYIDEYEGEVVVLPPYSPSAPAVADEWEDIPF